jgi:hypothetical protein
MRKIAANPSQVPPALMTLKDFAKWAGIGPTVARGEIYGGGLRAVTTCGRARIYVRRADAIAWLSSLRPIH